MFIGMFAWPIGLDDKEKLPCAGQVDTKPYYVCDPWDLDRGLWYQVYAAVILTIAQMLGTRIQAHSTRKVEAEEFIEKEREVRRQSMWVLDPDEEEGEVYGETDEPEDPDAKSAPKPRRPSARARADGTIGPLQTEPNVRETAFGSFWEEAFEEDPEMDVDDVAGGKGDGYLDIGDEEETANDPGGLNDVDARMLL